MCMHYMRLKVTFKVFACVYSVHVCTIVNNTVLILHALVRTCMYDLPALVLEASHLGTCT